MSDQLIGSRVGHFSVTSKLGEGGMGEVYRATDTRLNRDVAVKALPDSFVFDEQRLARFEREAQVLASLNHPNIAGIHGLEKEGTDQYLILELVEGTDLSDRLTQGPIPLEEALGLALQITEALDAAHEKGIIHRDLKPANIKITPQGQVKVLDFGLAKALEVEPSSGPDIENSPTLTMAATQAGIIIGTAGYMSPEQASGQFTDRRSDVWSFGVVLTEMLSGERLFTGETTSHVLAAVLQREIDLGEVLPNVPARIRRLIGRCLTKDLRKRLQAIGEARIAIEAYLANPGEESEAAGETASAAPTSGVSRWLPWGVAAALALALAWLGFRAPDPQAESALIRASIPPPMGSTFDLNPNNPGPVAVSPDGTSLAFSVRSSVGEIGLWVRRLDEPSGRLMQGTRNAAYPFWSPDSRSLAFFNDSNELKRLDLAGGPPVRIAEAINGKGGSWGADGTILFAPAHNTPIYRMDAAGGEATPATALDSEAGDISHRHPRFLPGDRHFIYLERTRAEGATSSRIVLAAVDGSEERVLLNSPAAAEYASGHILFLQEETLMARPFDLETMTFSGDSVALQPDVTLVSVGAARGVFHASDTGVLAYGLGQNRPGANLRWQGRSGAIEVEETDVARFMEVALSPDGELMILTIMDQVAGTSDLWVQDIERGLRSRFTFDPGGDTSPAWSPDGERVAFTSDRLGPESVFIKSVGGVGDEELLYSQEDVVLTVNDWTPDGRFILVAVFDDSQDTGWDIWALPLDGGDPVVMLETRANEETARVSPDGKWMAYMSDESGRDEIYVVPFPAAGRKWQVSVEGGEQPIWSSDGSEIFFRSPGGVIQATEVGTREETFLVGPMNPLFDGPPRVAVLLNFYPSPDGQRFIVLNPETRQGTRPMELTIGWPQILERR